jgi:hypothetical protein
VLLFEKFSGKLDRSKSQRLVTVPRHKCYQLGLKPSGRGQCAEGAAALEPISAPACNRELPRILLMRRWSVLLCASEACVHKWSLAWSLPHHEGIGIGTFLDGRADDDDFEGLRNPLVLEADCYRSRRPLHIRRNVVGAAIRNLDPDGRSAFDGVCAITI